MNTSQITDTRGKRTDYALVILMICVSGNPLLTDGRFNELVLASTAGLLAVVLVRRRRLDMTPASIGVLSAFAVILLAQGLAFSYLPVVTTLGFLVRLFIAYATVRAVGRFPRVFVNSMCVLAALGLGLYLIDLALTVAGVSMRTWFSPPAVAELCLIRYHVLVHNFNFSEGPLPYRNAGMMWEPSAFAGYLLVAAILLGLERPDTAGLRYKLRLPLLVVGVLSTQSTMGYLVLPLALGLHLALWVRQGGRLGLTGALACAAMLAAGMYLVWQLDFVGRKVADHYTHTAVRRQGWEMKRFGSLIYDAEYIRRRPLLGWGINEQTRRMLHPGTQLGRVQGNGMSDFIAKFGFVGFGVFLLSVWTGLYRRTHRSVWRATFALALLTLALNGETFLGHPLFLSLMFLSECGVSGAAEPAARAVAPLGRRALGAGPA